ncbi:MAG TPA: alpha/beta fold hydrolase [Nocardioides sp.]|uniref:alpha/beta hydrolase family protein n=1 Tax=Nocardioides sp. TaxID=35761 RepID=UPI002EDB5A3D
MRLRVTAAAAVLALPLVACSDDAPGSAPGGSPSSVEPSGTPSVVEPTGAPSVVEPSGTPSVVEPTSEASRVETTPRATSPVSLPALMREELPTSRIRVLRERLSTDAYRRFEVAYRADDVRVTGVLYRPRGRGPFPGVVLAHGHIEPSIYVTGQGLTREQIRLANEGFAVLHTDYRGHAGSDPATGVDVETRLGYARDTIAAVQALAGLPYVDPERLGLLGRSMGGGVVMDVLVARPGLVDAAVLYASVSSRFLDNLRRWTIPERPDAAEALFDRFGRPGQRPEFYAGLSPRTYFDRITEPVLAHHGTSDDSCPIRWAHTTHDLMRRAGVDSRLRVYQGEEHAFGPQWDLSMRRTVRFLRAELD